MLPGPPKNKPWRVPWLLNVRPQDLSSEFAEVAGLPGGRVEGSVRIQRSLIWVVVKMLVPEIDVKSELPRCRLMS